MSNPFFTNPANIVSYTRARAGVVSGDFDAVQAGFDIVQSLKADLASPTFTGTPRAPTQSANDNSTKLATTAYVDANNATMAGYLSSAQTQATNALNSANAASASATTASDQATLSTNYAATAATAATNAQNYLISFRDVYYGALASDPALNPDGGAVKKGDTYFNTTTNTYLVYNGSAWVTPAGGGGTVTSVNASGGTTGLTFSGGPITTSGTLTAAGTLVVANGGTGVATLTGIVKGNGTGAFTAAAAGTDYVAPAGTFFIGTTSIAHNRSSGALVLTGITSIDGSAAKLTTARTIAGTSFDGSANVTLANKFIVQGTTDAGLTGAQFLGSLATGIVKNTTTTGVLSIAAAGTDYQAAITATGVLKGNGSGSVSAATDGTDYVAPGTATTFTAVQTFVGTSDTRTALGNITGASIAVNCALGSFFSATVTGNVTSWTMSNVAASGKVSAFILNLTNGGAFTVTWSFSGSTVKWAGGSAPSLSASGRDILSFWTDDGGTTWNGNLLQKGVA